MTDYINDTFIRLTEEGRIRDAVAFCEMVADSAPSVEFQCIALKDLAECHFFMTGDGEACREANLRGLQLMEENPEILEGTPHMDRKLVRRMYSDFCEQFRSVAVSFEEYEEHCEKPLKVRERNATEKRGLEAVANLKSQNAGWKENMFLLLDNYFPQTGIMTPNTAPSQGSCLAQLILLNRRKLRTVPLDVNFSIQQYMNCTLANVEKLIQNCGAKKVPPDADQLLFMIDRASALIETMRDDRQADQPTVEICLEKLADTREHVENLCSGSAIRSELMRAERRPDYLTLGKITEGFEEQMYALRDVRLRDVDVGLNQGRRKVLDPVLEKKLKKIFGWLLFAAGLFLFAWVVWKLNVFSLTR